MVVVVMVVAKGGGSDISSPVLLRKSNGFVAGSGFVSGFQLLMLMLMFIRRFVLFFRHGLSLRFFCGTTSAREFKVQDAVNYCCNEIRKVNRFYVKNACLLMQQ